VPNFADGADLGRCFNHLGFYEREGMISPSDLAQILESGKGKKLGVEGRRRGEPWRDLRLALWSGKC
jgi:hypothetical protein